MKSEEKLLVRVLQGKPAERIPFWFMRQAGRYLAEYRELRAKNRNFLEFCYNPEMAAEATLQPIRRFGMDGAIIFSDILVIPHALGMHVWFEEQKGPRLDPVQTQKVLEGLKPAQERLEPVYQAIRNTRAQLPEETAMIGFAGSPWTLACYVVEGGSSKDFQRVCDTATRDRPFFTQLIDRLAQAVTQHAMAQIEAGAEIIQLFDSWAGVLDAQAFDDWIIAPTQRIVHTLKERHPHVPVIGFPRQAKEGYIAYAKKTGVNAISLDQSVSLNWARQALPEPIVRQGNLDPVLLAEDKSAMIKAAGEIIAAWGDKPFVFNLGHGILPHTPVAHVQALCDFLKTA